MRKTTIFTMLCLVSMLVVNYVHAASWTNIGGPCDICWSTAGGLSADGTIIIGSVGVEGWGPVTWTPTEGFSFFECPNAPPNPNYNDRNITDISANGKVIVGYYRCRDEDNFIPDSEQPPTIGFRWTESEGCSWLGQLPGDDGSIASAVSADRSVVVGNSGVNVLDDPLTQTEAFRLTQSGGMVGLGFLPGQSESSASDVSADGSVVVGTSGGQAFRWTQSTGMVGLGFLPGSTRSGASAVSANGSVIVGVSYKECYDPDDGWVECEQAFRWTKSTGMVGLGLLPGCQKCSANDVSGDGSIVVGTCSSIDSGPVAFIWDKNTGMRNLADVLINDYGIGLGDSSTMWQANAISSDGTKIAGNLDTDYGMFFGWYADIACSLDNKFVGTKAIKGVAYYTDRHYTLTDVPDYYANMPMIKTPNDERFNDAPNSYLSFKVAVDTNVYVAFDKRATSLPDWMDDFIDTGDILSTSLATQGYLKIYAKLYTEGQCVDLGGNYGPGSSSETRSNYFVMYESLVPCELDPRFETDDLTTGMYYYTDRSYKLTNVPGQYINLPMIKTPNADRNLTTASDYLTFEMPHDGTVLVAYDSRAICRPAWMIGFIDTGDVLLTSLSTQLSLKIYSKAYYEGDCVNLGANKAAGFTGATVSNYIVLYSDGDVGPGECMLDTKYNVSSMAIGAYYYTDRDYMIAGGVPDWMLGRMMIQTPNDERFSKAASGYIRFTNPVSWWVYVLFDSRSASIPDWLNGWELRAERITTSLATQPYLKMYRKMFDANQCVDLGGNYGPGSSTETRSNYVVVYGK